MVTGSVINGSAGYFGSNIAGLYGVHIGGAGSVTNFGDIRGLGSFYGFGDGVDILGGGAITNGSAVDPGALIAGARGAYIAGGAGTVSNFGQIAAEGAGLSAVQLHAGGAVVNGSAFDVQANIYGASGVNIGGAVGSVVNFGAITGQVIQGVVLYSGGNVVNGSLLDRSAAITGYSAVVLGATGGKVFNYGTIRGEGTNYQQAGVSLTGGVVINGRGADLGALIEGASGVLLSGVGTVANDGAILGATQAGVQLSGAGVVTNGDGAHRSALIEGYGEGVLAGGAVTITNAGTIRSSGLGDGVLMNNGGTLTNGALNNGGALIQGYGGLLLSGGTASNFGTISAVGLSSGVFVRNGGVIVNGAQGHAGALIEGYYGVGTDSTSSTTVTNFGTIEAQGGFALSFHSATDELVVEAGSTFVGAALGGGGTLNLASGVGTISNFGVSALTVSGSMAAATFSDFNTIEVASGAQFTDTGAVAIAAGQSVVVSGVLSLGGTGSAHVANAGVLAVTGGTLTVVGAVTGQGKVTIAAGTAAFASSFAETVTFSTTGVLQLAQSQGYTGSITSFSKTGATSLDLLDIGFTGAGEASFSGTTKGGVLTVTDGTHTAHINLRGNYLGSTFIASSDGHGGTIVVDPKKAPPQAFVAAMASMAPAAARLDIADRAWREPALSLAVNAHIASF